MKVQSAKFFDKLFL